MHGLARSGHKSVLEKFVFRVCLFMPFGLPANSRRQPLFSRPERPGVERSPVCVGPDAQCERSETEHRGRSKWASKRNGEAFKRRDKLKSGAAWVRRFRGAVAKAAALRTRGKSLSQAIRDGGTERSGRARWRCGSLAELKWSGVQTA